MHASCERILTMEISVAGLPGRLMAGALAALLCVASVPASADVVLFTATTDNSFGIDPVSVPGTNNVNIPLIDPSVSLSPSSALLDGNVTGPLNGVTYGPFGFGGNGAGNTGWVESNYTVATSGFYRLIWEVAGADFKIGSALTIDNVRVNGGMLFGFESGIPGGFLSAGSLGTSGALTVTTADGSPLPDFRPTEGSSFAYLDIKNNGVAPIYDTVDGFVASRLYSTVFNLSAGDTISLDEAFMTNDGAPFYDYGIAVLVSVPEPSSLVSLTIGLGVLGTLFCVRARFQLESP